MKHAVSWGEIVTPVFLEPEPGELFRKLTDQVGAVYFISSRGRLYSMLKQRYLKGNKRQVFTQFYCQYMLSDHFWRPTHQLVMRAFGPPQPSPKHEIDHIDNNGGNNVIENLQWVTRAENIALSFARGRKIKRGPDHWNHGKTPSAETRAKMSASKRGAKHPRFAGYWVVDRIRYNSTSEAAESVGTYPKRVYNWCRAGRNGWYFEPVSPKMGKNKSKR